MRIAITGINGFVGSYVAKQFPNCSILGFARNPNEVQLPLSDIEGVDADIFFHFAGKSKDTKHTNDAADYYESNVALTKKVFDAFLASNATKFVFLSSVKAVTDNADVLLTEDVVPNPQTHYGKSKLEAEEYIFSKALPATKNVYVLRPCIIYGPELSGNLKSLYKLVSKGIPWPFGSFDNSRSYLSLDNLCFVLKEISERDDMPSGTYNIADNEPLSTIELIGIIGNVQEKKVRTLRLNKNLILYMAKIGDKLRLPFNTENLLKLTGNYLVSNTKLLSILKRELPKQSLEGITEAFKSLKAENP